MTQPNDFNQDPWKEEEKNELLNTNNEIIPNSIEEEPKNKISFSLNVIYRVLRSLVLIGIILIAAFGFLGVGLGAGYFASLVSTVDVPGKEELSQKINDVEQQSKIVYSNGDLISVIKSDLIRTSVKSDNISPLIKKALVSTEDENFYEHPGIVPKALIRATVSDLTGIGGSSGGSTITQQLIKQQVLTSEASYKRKAPEILIAMRTEKFFSKEEILNAYLNVSPFGRNNKGENIAGIEEAALGIFNVHANEVTLPQAAFLAGLPQSPIEYTPYTNDGQFKESFEAGLNRKNDVLFNMYREKVINKKEYEEAKAYDLTKDFKEPASAQNDDSGYLYNYLYDEAARLIAPIYYEKDGITADEYENGEDSEALQTKYSEIAKRELRQNGYTVHSSIDKTIYNAMQEATAQYGYILDDGSGQLLQTGSVLMDNQTGRIYGFIGGRDYSQNQFNHAFQSHRSPGSTIKPILAYAPAIDAGIIGSESMLADYSKKYSTGIPIKNYSNNGTNSFKSVRESLKMSYNIPVVNLYQDLLQVADPKSYFDKMNVHGIGAEEFTHESIPLGGTTTGPTVNEETAAFATLANKGAYNEGYSIDKITDNDGNVIYEHEANPVQVYKSSTASIMNDMMRDVLNSGTATVAKGTLNSLSPTLASADWVGKTGTSQEEKDFWFIASTPTVTLSNWIGYDEAPMLSSWGQQNMIFWSYVANAVYQQNPDIFGVNERFTLDPSVNQQTVVARTGELPGSFNSDGFSINTSGEKTTTSYFSEGSTAPNAKYRFGIGGSEDNYRSYWNSYVKPKETKKETKKATTKKKADD